MHNKAYLTVIDGHARSVRTNAGETAPGQRRPAPDGGHQPVSIDGDRTMTVCVHGLGYVGLSTAALFANSGYDVVGYDTDTAVVESLRDGEVRVSEPELEAYVQSALSDGLTVSEEIVDATAHLICVPTPYEDGADLTYVEQAAAGIADHLRPGDTVVVESTVPPRTTASTVAPLLAESGLSAGEEFSLAYAPETILPGNTVTELRTNDRIVGGVDDDSALAVRDLYDPAVDGTVHLAPDATTAEFVKLSQNAFRDVNIAFANELALVARDYGVDVRAAIDLANTHPRVDVLDPGPGVGGHCLPVDPLFLTAGSDETALIESARRVNDRMPGHLVDRLREELGTLADARIAVLGIAYKGNVDETRNSPGLALAGALGAATVKTAPLADGGSGTVDVRLSDPLVTDESLALVDRTDALRGADAAVLAADHDAYAALDPGGVAELLRGDLVIDPFGLLDRSEWRAAGLRVEEL